jgi:KipI family sensor histidine kinase inhibitor
VAESAPRCDPADSPAAAEIDGLRILIAGDRFLLLELGRKMELPLNLRAIQLADRLLQESVAELIETLPMFVSVLVHYDSLRLSPTRLIEVIARVWQDLAHERDIVLPSRTIEIPVLYLDPWTKDCVEEYSRTIRPIEDDPTYVARLNGLPDPEALVRLHSGTQHWVGGVGFYPGLPDMLPLDPRCVLSVPKYNPPRLRTTARAVGVGGAFTSIYPMDTPGGYHLIGRTPVPIYSSDSRLAPFRRQATLFQPGDGIKFRRIDRAEYDAIEAEVGAGSYRYLICDYDLFSLSRYEAWTEALTEPSNPGRCEGAR